MGESGYQKWRVNIPGVFHFSFNVQSHEIEKKTLLAKSVNSYQAISVVQESHRSN